MFSELLHHRPYGGGEFRVGDGLDQYRPSLQRASVVRRLCDGEVQADRIRAPRVGAGVSRAGHQHVALAYVLVDEGGWGLHRLGRHPCDFAERCVRVAGLRDGPSRPDEAAQPAVVLLLTLVPQRVVQGDGGLLSDGAGHADLVRVEAALVLVLDQDHHSEQLTVEDQRHREPRLLAPPVHVLGVWSADVRIRAGLLHDHAGAQRVEAAGVSPDRVGRALEAGGDPRHGIPLPETAEHCGAPAARVLPDDALRGVQCLTGGARDAAQHLVVVDRRGDGTARLEQGLQLGGAAAERLLHVLALRDVFIRTSEPEQLTHLVEHGYAAREQHDLTAVLVPIAVLEAGTASPLVRHALEARRHAPPRPLRS